MAQTGSQRRIHFAYGDHRRGKIFTGYLTSKSDEALTIRNPTSGVDTTIPLDEVDEHVPASTLMPDGLTTAMTRQQQLDLIKFVTTLGTKDAVSLDKVSDLMGADACAWSREIRVRSQTTAS
ncbi:MAG: hypothetical protein R3C11_02710 [Planctomycetaceae bacterium]